MHKCKKDLREMKLDAQKAETWIGKTDRKHLKKARLFIDKLEMLTDLCVYRTNRVIDVEDKKKKKNEDEMEEQEEKEDSLEFLNLTELQ